MNLGRIQHASTTPFDKSEVPAGVPITADNTFAAIIQGYQELYGRMCWVDVLSRNGNVTSGNWLYLGQNMPSNTSPYFTVFPLECIGYFANATSNTNGILQLVRLDTNGVLLSMPFAGQNLISSTANVFIQAGLRLGVRVNNATISNPVCGLFFRRP